MKTLLILLLSSILSVAGADEIYKWVDGRGGVHYGDEPGQRSAVKMDRLPELTTYEPLPFEYEEDEVTSVDKLPQEPEQQAISYQSITIISPENDQSIRSNQGTVEVFVAIDPPLGETDHLRVMLDGEFVPDQYDTGVFQLNNVERGEHRLSVSVYSDQGKNLIISDAHIFHLQKVSVINRPAIN